MEFTEKEVREKLKELGYVNVPQDKLKEFMFDLQELIDHENSFTTDEDTPTQVAHKYDSSPNEEFSTRKPLQHRNYQQAFSIEKVPSVNSTVIDEENLSHLRSSTSSSCYPSYAEENDVGRQSNTKKNPLKVTVKRKVARKKGGNTRIFDETFSEADSEYTDITAIEEHLRNLPVSEASNQRPTSSLSCRSQSTCSGESSVPSAAFIRANHSHPHTRGFRKADPVARYHQFKEEWKQTKIPGETKHSALRWHVRELMLNYEVYEKPKRQPTTNDYVVPTDKKRQTLRWQVRSSMAR